MTNGDNDGDYVDWGGKIWRVCATPGVVMSGGGGDYGVADGLWWWLW